MHTNNDTELKEIAAWHFECFERSLSYRKALEEQPAMALGHLREALNIVAALCKENTKMLQELRKLGEDLLSI